MKIHQIITEIESFIDIKYHTFVVTYEDYIRTWKHLTEEFWGAAFKRYQLEEFDEKQDFQG